MKKLIFGIFLFFSLGIFNSFAQYIKPEQEFVMNGETYFFRKEGEQSKIYKKSDLTLSGTYRKFDFLRYDVGSKKYFYKQNNQFYVINDDFTPKYIFNRYQDDHYSTLYKLEPFNKFNLPSGFYYSQDTVFNNNYLFTKYNNQTKIFTIRTYSKDNKPLDYEYSLDGYYYKTIVAIDDETILGLKGNAENGYNTFTYNFLTKELVENHDNFYKDGNNEIEIFYDYGDKYTIKSGNNIKTGKIGEKLKCENKEITSEYIRSFWDGKNFVLDNYEHTEGSNDYHIYFGEEGKKYIHRVSLYNAENVAGFNFEDLTRKENGNYLTFDPENGLGRHFGTNFLYNYPYFRIEVNSEISWIKINGELPKGFTNFGYLVKCLNGEKIEGSPRIEIGKIYKLPEVTNSVCFNYNGFEYGTAKIKIDFGDFGTQTLNHKICENEDGQITIDGKKTYLTKENIDEYFTPVDVNVKDEIEKNSNVSSKHFYDFLFGGEKAESDKKINGEGILKITNGQIKNPIIENGKCKLFNDNLNFIYYSDGTSAINFSFKDFGLLNNDFGGLLDFISGLFIGPFNNIIGLTKIVVPFYEDNQKICLFGEVKTIEFHSMMKDTEYYGKMTFFDYLVLFVFGLSVYNLLGFGGMARGSIGSPSIEYEQVKNKNSLPKNSDIKPYKSFKNQVGKYQRPIIHHKKSTPYNKGR